ncbi:MAG: nuclease A inhibitor family protein [Nostoc sp.]
MAKLLICDRCLLYAHNPYLVCAVHLDGVDGDSCLDFREDPNIEPEELWQPEGATYYSLGNKEIDVYVVGKTPTINLAGIFTKIVET